MAVCHQRHPTGRRSSWPQFLSLLDEQRATQSLHKFLHHSVLRYTEADNPKGCLVDLGMVNYSRPNRCIQRCRQSVSEKVFRRVEDCLVRAQRQGCVLI